MTQSSGSDIPEKPKLIIDEDWKTHVQREREEALRQKSSVEQNPVEQNPVEKSPVDKSSGKQGTSAKKNDPNSLPPPPPASFPFLVSMLGTQALAAMGQLGAEEDAPTPRLDYAKHYIDLLGVLEEKTKNNLSPEEAKLVGDWLYQLRIGYVEMVKKSTAG